MGVVARSIKLAPSRRVNKIEGLISQMTDNGCLSQFYVKYFRCAEIAPSSTRCANARMPENVTCVYVCVRIFAHSQIRALPRCVAARRDSLGKSARIRCGSSAGNRARFCERSAGDVESSPSQARTHKREGEAAGGGEEERARRGGGRRWYGEAGASGGKYSRFQGNRVMTQFRKDR